MDFKFNRKRLNQMPEQTILKELEMAAKKFGYIEFGRRDFDKIASISSSTVRKHYGGSWTKALEALKTLLQEKGLNLTPRPYSPNRLISDKQLFDEMEHIWQKVGQRPSRDEWETSQPKYAYNTYKARFGGWTNACLKFIEYKMGNIVLADMTITNIDNNKKAKTTEGIGIKHDNTRSIPLSLRLDVLNRDNFRCVYCGKSPATDIGTKLHIDHIIPFSKGGKTVLENLQTLCFDCNLGKSDKDLKTIGIVQK